MFDVHLKISFFTLRRFSNVFAETESKSILNLSERSVDKLENLRKFAERESVEKSQEHNEGELKFSFYFFTYLHVFLCIFLSCLDILLDFFIFLLFLDIFGFCELEKRRTFK